MDRIRVIFSLVIEERDESGMISGGMNRQNVVVWLKSLGTWGSRLRVEAYLDEHTAL